MKLSKNDTEVGKKLESEAELKSSAFFICSLKMEKAPEKTVVFALAEERK